MDVNVDMVGGGGGVAQSFYLKLQTPESKEVFFSKQAPSQKTNVVESFSFIQS